MVLEAVSAEEPEVLDADHEGRALLLARRPEPPSATEKNPAERETSQLWLRPNTYPLERQLAAAYGLSDRPSRRHAPLLRLFASGAGWPTVEPHRWPIADFVILEGPPGSGKSTAICELVTQLVLRDKRVLLVASTHVAVDNVLERVSARQEASEEQHVLPVRIGEEHNITSQVVEPWCYERLLKTSRDNVLDFLDRARSDPRSSLGPRARGARKQLEDALSRDDTTLSRLILDSANLVCGTTIGILQHPEVKRAAAESKAARQSGNYPELDSGVGFRPFDVMILDEASKTTFGEFLVPALLCERWIIVGDAKQLSPYVETDELEANLAGIVKPDVAIAAMHGARAARQKPSLVATTSTGPHAAWCGPDGAGFGKSAASEEPPHSAGLLPTVGRVVLRWPR